MLNLIIHLDTQNWHHQVMEINCFASVCGVQVMPYGCTDTDTFGGFFFWIGWLVKRQMVVFSFFVSVFQIWSGTSPRSKLATQHWKRYNDVCMCVCVCVCVCVCTRVCVCVWCTTVFFHSLQHEDCCIKRQYVREGEREGERVYSLCDKLTATKHS